MTKLRAEWTDEAGTKVGRVVVGDTYTLNRDLPVMCCSRHGKVGERVTIYSRHSPKRVWISFPDANPNSMHKCKASKIHWEEDE